MTSFSHGTIEVFGIAVAHLVSFGIALAAWHYAYVPSCVDSFREVIFRLRRELFLFMAEGNISPDHPAYKELRANLNGLLRHAERFTFWWTFAVMIAFGGKPNPIDAALEAMPNDNVRMTLASIRSRAARALFRQVCRRTPLVALTRWCIYLPIRKMIDLSKITHRMVQRFAGAVTAEARLLDESCEA